MRSKFKNKRGMALFLVLIAISIATLLGATFLAESENAANIGKRSDERLQARLIAEAGLTMAVKYVNSEPNWRTVQTNGQWITDQSLSGGTYSILGQDGSGVDSSGNVAGGDGSLSDNASDPVVLTSIGVYQNARYRVRAVLNSGSGSTIAVSDRIILKSNAIIDSYSSSVGAPSAENQGAVSCVSSNSTGAKNISLSIGSRINGTLYLPAGGSSANAVQIFSPFVLLNLILDHFNIPLNVPVTNIISNGVSNFIHDGFTLNTVVMPAHATSTNNVKYTGNDAPTLNGDLVCNSLDLQGNAVLTVTGPSRIICDGDFSIKNNANIVLQNPRFGNTTPFSSSQTNIANKQIAMPIALAKTIQIKTLGAYVKRNNAKMRMAVYSNSANAPGALLAQSNGSTLSSNSLYWHEVSVPTTTLAPGNYWIALSFDDANAGYAYSAGGTAKVRNNSAVANGFLNSWGASDSTLAQNINMYISGNVDGMGGSLQIFVAGNWDFNPKFTLNQETQQADRLVLYPLNPDPDAKFSISGDVAAYATIYAPGITLELNDFVNLYGKIRVGNLIMTRFASLHVDTSNGLTLPGAIIDENIILNHFSSIDGISGDAIVACNSAGNPAIWVQGYSAIKGDAYSGPGDTPSVQIGSHSVLTGTPGNLSAVVNLAMPATPSLSGSSNITYNNASTLNSSFKCSSLTFSNNAVVTVNGDCSVVVTGNTVFQGNARLVLNPGAKLTLYCQGDLSAKDTAQINVDGNPTTLVLNAYSANRIILQNSSHITGTLRAENAEVRLLNDAQLSGSVFSKRIYIESNGKIHYDKSGSGSQMAWIEGQ